MTWIGRLIWDLLPPPVHSAASLPQFQFTPWPDHFALHLRSVGPCLGVDCFTDKGPGQSVGAKQQLGLLLPRPKGTSKASAIFSTMLQLQ